MTKQLFVLFGILILSGCAGDPYTKTTTQSGSTSSCSAAGSASFQLAIKNVPSGTATHTYSGTMTPTSGTAVTLSANATAAAGLLTGQVTPGSSYTIVLKDGATTFFSGTISLSGTSCSYSATVDYQTHTITNGG